ncbi:hypothetical protein HJC23_005149 [Cyclotella cryptica]|uniref:rhomboid protease n=1 Tax=Cyclotella cryptica TaxID=29204 RepID=A0ABD3QF13_9STRA
MTQLPPRNRHAQTHGENKSSPSGANSGFRVYNPVEDSFEGWPAEPSFENDSNAAESNELDSFRENYSSSHVAAAVSTDNRLRDNDGHDRSLSSARNTPGETQDDTALARAIAEQDLPPGVSAIEQQEVMMRLLTQQLRRGDWSTGDEGSLPPELEQRLREFQSLGSIAPSFQFAQRKRRETYGDERPWGILGLYDHLAGIRVDVEWAEDAAWRRAHKEPYLSWADFQQTRDTGWNRPFFTYILLVVCTVVLIASYGLNGWKVEPLSVNPMIGPSAETLLRMGAKQTSLIVNQGEWYRLFSPMVLHAGLIHYFLNMTALWFIGKAVEQCHGFAAAAIIFIIPAVGGTIMSAIFLPEYISVGASGGIFGLIGACIADICINWSLLFSKHVNSSDEGTRFRHLKVLMWLLFDIVINCLVGLTPFVDNFTHLGGMVYGFLCGLSTIERLSTDFFGIATSTLSRIRNLFVRFSGLLLSVVLIMVTTALLVESDGGASPCSSCRYVSCVPFPPWAGEDAKWWYCDDCSRVTADAKLDSSGYYSLSLTCPDGVIEEIDLSDELVTDRQWIRRQLPNLCRKHCENLFAS